MTETKTTGSTDKAERDDQRTRKELHGRKRLVTRSGRKTTFRLKPRRFYFSF